MASQVITSIMKHSCDGCGRVQYGTLGKDCHGISGTAIEHTDPSENRGTEWFACKPSCVRKAVLYAVTEGWRYETL